MVFARTTWLGIWSSVTYIFASKFEGIDFHKVTESTEKESWPDSGVRLLRRMDNKDHRATRKNILACDGSGEDRKP
jgi:hypothetical protein